MKIKFLKDWMISFDKRNYILHKKCEESEKGRKGDGWRIKGYYIDLEHLVHELVELSICFGKASTLQELVNDTKELKKTLTTQIKLLKS